VRVTLAPRKVAANEAVRASCAPALSRRVALASNFSPKCVARRIVLGVETVIRQRPFVFIVLGADGFEEVHPPLVPPSRNPTFLREVRAHPLVIRFVEPLACSLGVCPQFELDVSPHAKTVAFVEEGAIALPPADDVRHDAANLLAALLEEDRGLWATALYAGLRRGELLGLRFEDIDLAGGVIHVERAFDPVARVMVAPKSVSGVRTVPVPSVLREYLAAQRLRTGRGEGLTFGEDGGTPFDSLRVTRRAHRVWKAAGLLPVGLHEARHCYASLMIAAGVNAKALSTYMGHSSVVVTYDRYGHLFPGNEGEAAKLLDRYILSTVEVETRG
jgi:Phage integrase family